jgi:hypothetical protein
LWSLLPTIGPTYALISTIPALITPVLTPLLSPADGHTILILAEVCDAAVSITFPACDPSDVPVRSSGPPGTLFGLPFLSNNCLTNIIPDLPGPRRASLVVAGILVLGYAPVNLPIHHSLRPTEIRNEKPTRSTLPPFTLPAAAPPSDLPSEDAVVAEKTSPSALLPNRTRYGVWHTLPLPLPLMSPTGDPATCVCGGTQEEHGASNIPSVLPRLPATQRTVTAPSLTPTPGPNRPIIDSSPITHAFSQHQHPHTSERRAISASRATVRNRGGIPSHLHHPPRPRILSLLDECD